MTRMAQFDGAHLRRGLIGILIGVSVGGGFSLLWDSFLFGEEMNKEEPVISKKSDSPVRVVLHIEKATYPLKAPISMNLLITHEKPNEPAPLGFSSAQRYDFIIAKDDKEIWRWSEGRVFATMVDGIILQPGEYLRYREIWDQKDEEGAPVLPGRYRILGVLKTYPEVTSEPIVVEIKAESTDR